MKRSEMIKIMTNKYLELQRGGWSEATEEERFNEVLREMEKYGIRPPNIHKCFSHDCEHIQEYKWESEKRKNK